MRQTFTRRDLGRMMQRMYPEVEDDRDDNLPYPHPMTVVGIVLLSAAILESIDLRTLTAFTGCSQEFISAITLNMVNNGLWIDGKYDHSAWLMSDRAIDSERFWQHIEMACGVLWMPERHTDCSVDPCEIYWDEPGGFRALPRRR